MLRCDPIDDLTACARSRTCIRAANPRVAASITGRAAMSPLPTMLASTARRGKPYPARRDRLASSSCSACEKRSIAIQSGCSRRRRPRGSPKDPRHSMPTNAENAALRAAVGVTPADDLVDGRDALGPVRERATACRAAHREHPFDPRTTPAAATRRGCARRPVWARPSR